MLLSGSYSDLASEYYDPVRHPTCANFREGSHNLVVSWLRRIATDRDDVLETGAGASLVAEWLEEEKRQIASLVVTDASQEMLRYSKRPSLCFEMIVCDAQITPLASGSFDVVVASLGDPYNTLRFWKEAARLLRPDGHVLFTSPSFEWATQFRDRSNAAEFILSDGRMIAVPSLIVASDDQRRMIEASGLALLDVQAFMDTELRSSPRSPKLCPGPIVSGYLAQKRSGRGRQSNGKGSIS